MEGGGPPPAAAAPPEAVPSPAAAASTCLRGLTIHLSLVDAIYIEIASFVTLLGGTIAASFTPDVNILILNTASDLFSPTAPRLS